MIEFPFEIKIPKDEIELEELVYKIYEYSRAQAALECSLMCDRQRGFLSIGHQIRETFGLVQVKNEQKIEEPKKSNLTRVK